MPIKKTSVFYQAMILTGSSLILQILFFVYRIIITRISGAGGLGVYQLALPFYSVVSSICLSGVTMAVTRISAESDAAGVPERTETLMNRAIKIFLIPLAALTLFTYLFSDIVSGNILGDIRTRGAVILFIPCLFFTGFENIYKSFFYGMRYVRPNIISEITEISIRIAAIFLLLSFNKPLTPEKTAFLIVLGMTLSEVFSFSFLGIYYRKYKKKNIVMPQNFMDRRRATRGVMSEIAKIAVPVSASSLLMTILSSINTVLIPQRLVASGMTQNQAVEILGIMMGMVSPVVMLPAIFVGPLTNVIMPRISKALKLGNIKEVHGKIAKSLMTCSFLAFPAMGIIAAVGSPLCVLMYKNETAGQYIFPLTLSSIFVYFQIITGSILYGINKQKQVAVYNVIDGAIHIFFTYFFVAIPNFNIYGFLLGHFFSSFVGTILNTTAIVRHTKIKIKFGNWFFLPLTAGAYTGFMTFTAYSLLQRSALPQILCVIFSALFGFLIYAAILEMKNISLVRYLKGLQIKEPPKKILKKISKPLENKREN